MSAPLHEPHKFKTVRNLSFPALDERKRYLQDARFNVFHLTPTQVSFEMSARGMGAMSQEQVAGLFVGDEAYAGARNFEALEAAVSAVFDKRHLIPAHNLLGAVQVVMAAMAPAGSIIPVNCVAISDMLELRQNQAVDVRAVTPRRFRGDLDLTALETAMDRGVALVWIEAFADGRHPVSLANLEAVKALALERGVPLVLDGSRVVENALAIQRHEEGRSGLELGEIIRMLASCADMLVVDAAQDARGQTGGLVATNSADDLSKLVHQVVLFEGLHTYGGMTGRGMQAFAIGLRETTAPGQASWIEHQARTLHTQLLDAGVPFLAGCDGAYLEADRFLPHLSEHHEDTLTAALYLSSGIRAVATGRAGRDHLVPVQIPRLAMTNHQIEYVAEAITALHRQRNAIRGLTTLNAGAWRDEMRYRWILPELDDRDYYGAPHVVSVIERVGALTRAQRRDSLEEAGYNTFLLRSADVGIDLLSDSGTAAMSTEQWAALIRAAPSATATDEYHQLVELLQDAWGYEHVIPTHQGRAAEHILSQCHVLEGQHVPGNMYFTTTRLHQEMAGAVFADVIVDEAYDPTSEFRWKGNIDLAKLDAIVQRQGADTIAYVSFEHSVDLAGGQPASMPNMKEVYAYCSERGIPVFFDGTRCMENACMIARYDPTYRGVPAREVLREMMSYGDGCTVSGKKDFLVNMGGILAFRDNIRWKEQAWDMLRLYGGNVTDGGLPAADLAAMTQGIEEMLEDGYIFSRLDATALLAERLQRAGVPVVRPAGSHAVFIDATRFLPHLDADALPAQRLAAAIYMETGARTIARGTLPSGREPESGGGPRPVELVRLAIPRRVYSNDHLAAVADGVVRLFADRHLIRGLSRVSEPSRLGLLRDRYAPVEG